MFQKAIVTFLTLACFSVLIVGFPETQPEPEPEPVNPYIVGGEEATPYEFPFIISLRLDGEHRCGGFIYKNNVIITAAHCVDGLSKSDRLTIVAGIHRISNSPKEPSLQSKKVTKFLVHSKYNEDTMDNDIAMLLIEPLRFNTEVDLLKLPQKNQTTIGSLEVIGWGKLGEQSVASDTLQKVTVPMVNQSYCKNAYAQTKMTITDNMICAGLGGKDSCQGDSGGPAISVRNDRYVAGIVSFGVGCARPNFPGVYTNVANYVEWIETNGSEQLKPIFLIVLPTLLLTFFKF